MAIPPMVLVMNIDFLLIGIEFTKSTLLFLKTYPNKHIDITIGRMNIPKKLIIDKTGNVITSLEWLLSFNINNINILIIGIIPINTASAPFDFFKFCFK